MKAETLSSVRFMQEVAIARECVADSGYATRVYAALLGKVIGVYVGRPFEGWDYAAITKRFGQIDRYVAEDLDKLIVVTDDDIAGTMTFIRAAADSGRGYDTDSVDVADAWLNYLIEGRSVLWWGGLGNSTEHTAFLRLKSGYQPPESGSAELNGQVVSEQIGAQIFIDGWGLIAPGAPFLAAELARRAAVVSHDGEAVFGAQMVAAMEAAAFLTADIDQILDAGLATIPRNCLIARLVADLRTWRSSEPDWRRARELLDERYGYHHYGGGCHMIPNHGVIILTLLYCDSDFSTAMTIVNTAGWDTDCNSGNVGCLLGLIAGLESIDRGYDWRGPVADRLYVPTADSGSGISDVASETHKIVGIASRAAGLDRPSHPRFGFAFPGSVQGFRLTGEGAVESAPLPAASRDDGFGLRVDANDRVELTTPTFIPLEARAFTSYPLDAAPTIYSGQELTIRYLIDPARSEHSGDVRVTAIAKYYDDDDHLVTEYGPSETRARGDSTITWILPSLDGRPICEVGVEVENSRSDFFLNEMDWSGTPTADLVRRAGTGEMWRKSWVSETDFDHPDAEEGLRLISNGARRLAMTGTREWTDYRIEAQVIPHWANAVGVAVRVQGRGRYYLLRIHHDGRAQLIRRFGGTDEIVVQATVPWSSDREVSVRLDADGSKITAFVDQVLIGSVADDSDELRCGGIAISCEAGRVGVSAVRVTPLPAH